MDEVSDALAITEALDQAQGDRKLHISCGTRRMDTPTITYELTRRSFSSSSSSSPRDQSASLGFSAALASLAFASLAAASASAFFSYLILRSLMACSAAPWSSRALWECSFRVH